MDLVCRLHRCGNASPTAVYEAVYRRMAGNAVYKAILERKPRCMRLNYAGNFHLDIVPACEDEDYGGTFIKVPDCGLLEWRRSNPIGFADFFFGACKRRIVSAGIESLAKDIRPLPNPVPSAFKYPLQRIVQLMKRQRDRFFEGDNDAARSVVLSTLAATYYGGEQTLSEGLDRIVGCIHRVVETYPGILPVPNPSNPGENFADSWTVESYGRFKAYMRNFRKQLDDLLAAQGVESTNEKMGRLFGVAVAANAMNAYGGETERLRKQNLLRTAVKSGALTTATSGIAIPRNSFYGRK